MASSHIQTSPQPASTATYAINPTTNSSFVTTHMLGQGYGTESSNFGAIYHHNPHAYHTSPYHKVAPAPPTAANVYGNHYQGFYGHQNLMTRVDYIPR